MLEIQAPGNFRPERTYAIGQIIGEFLGLNFNLSFEDGIDHYTISLRNGRRLLIRDHLFSEIPEDDYLRIANLPQKVTFERNDFCPEADIPVLYGNGNVTTSEEDLTCCFDVFASTFLMLTQWESIANNARDVYGRFPGSESLAVRNGFLHRPVVDEYTEMIWNMLRFLGYEGERSHRSFEFVVTHDIDEIKRWGNIGDLVRALKNDFLRTGRAGAILDDLRGYQRRGNSDPYDSFDWLMDISEEAGIKSRFYLMAGGSHLFDASYTLENKKTREIIENIKKRNHLIGFHPSFETVSDPALWRKEKEALELACETEITEGRQHFLRFEVPTTWQIWEDNNMRVDSTLSFPQHPGFRCGTCHEFNTFNVLTRRQLKLRERPLAFMETVIVQKSNKSPEAVRQILESLTNTVKKYKGKLVILWHNSSLNTPFWRPFKDVYRKALEDIAQNKTNRRRIRE